MVTFIEFPALRSGGSLALLDKCAMYVMCVTYIMYFPFLNIEKVLAKNYGSSGHRDKLILVTL